MILNSTKFGGNRTKDVEVGPDRWTDERTDRPIPIYPPPQTMFAGGITTEPLDYSNIQGLHRINFCGGKS